MDLVERRTHVACVGTYSEDLTSELHIAERLELQPHWNRPPL